MKLFLCHSPPSYVQEVLVNCFALLLFAFLASRDCCVALPQDAMGLFAVCDCGIS